MADLPHSARLTRHGDRWWLVAAVVLIAAAGLHSLRPLWDFDTFWHLSTGRLVIASHKLPVADPFTYTAVHAWVHDEWLSEVFLAAAERGGGLQGLRILCAALVVAALALLWRLSRGAEPAARFLLVAVAWTAALPTASVRPHLVAFPLTVAVLAGLAPRAAAPEAPAAPAARWLGWLGRLAALWIALAVWINLHGSAVLVPALLAVATAGRLVDWLFDRTRRLPWECAAAAGVAASACLLQPSGLGLIGYVRETLSINDISEEWQPLLTADTWHSFPSVAILWCLLLAATLTAGWWERRGAVARMQGGVAGAEGASAFPDFWASLACLYLAAQHRRMILFAFVPMLWLGRYAGALWTDVSASGRRLLAGTALVTASALIFVALPDAVQRGPLRAGVYPEQATAFLAAADLDGRLFHDLGWGGYLELYRYPRQQVFADGRWWLAGPRMLGDYRAMALRDGDPRRVAALFSGYRVAVLVQSTPIVLQVAAPDRAAWTLAWIDPTATVLLRRDDAFAERRRRVCAFYAAHPALAPHAAWPRQLAPVVAVPAAPVRRDVLALPSILSDCPPSGG